MLNVGYLTSNTTAYGDEIVYPVLCGCASC